MQSLTESRFEASQEMTSIMADVKRNRHWMLLRTTVRPNPDHDRSAWRRHPSRYLYLWGNGSDVNRRVPLVRRQSVWSVSRDAGRSVLLLLLLNACRLSASVATATAGLAQWALFVYNSQCLSVHHADGRAASQSLCMLQNNKRRRLHSLKSPRLQLKLHLWFVLLKKHRRYVCYHESQLYMYIGP